MRVHDGMKLQSMNPWLHCTKKRFIQHPHDEALKTATGQCRTSSSNLLSDVEKPSSKTNRKCANNNGTEHRRGNRHVCTPGRISPISSQCCAECPALPIPLPPQNRRFRALRTRHPSLRRPSRLGSGHRRRQSCSNNNRHSGMCMFGRCNCRRSFGHMTIPEAQHPRPTCTGGWHRHPGDT